MAPSSSATYILDGLKVDLNDLRNISTHSGASVSSLVDFGERIVNAAEAIPRHRNLCDNLRDRILRLLVVVLTLVPSTGDKQNTALSSDLEHKFRRLESDLRTILKEVTNILSVTTSSRQSRGAATFFRKPDHAVALTRCSKNLEWAMKEFEVASRFFEAALIAETSCKSKLLLTNQNLESLPRTKYAGFNCERPRRPSRCADGTRTQLLNTITEWVVDPDPNLPRIFWLDGMAGEGKTTVACSIAEIANKMGCLGGQFAFSRHGEAELRDPALFFPTIAYQLARFDPDFKQRITAALEADPEAPYSSLKQQLDLLIIQPLSGLQREPSRVVLLILDAFDECEVRGAQEILQLLLAAIPFLHSCFKFFVTSRPEAHILSMFQSFPNISKLALYDVDASVAKGDIRRFLYARLRDLASEKDSGLRPDWAKDEEIESLVEEAGPWFLYATSCVSFLSEGFDLRGDLDVLLEIVESGSLTATTDNPFVYLDHHYQEILRGIARRADSEEVEAILLSVLGSIILLREPLPMNALELLADVDGGYVSRVLSALRSLILPPAAHDQGPRVYHHSFIHFLQDPYRCTDPRFWIDAKQHQARMGVRCLELLNTTLPNATLGDRVPKLLNNKVEDLEHLIKVISQLEIRYSCLHWASHVAAATEGDSNIVKALETFASKALLLWMEGMSLLGKLPMCLMSLEAINTWVTKSESSTSTKSLIRDGYRLLLAHLSIPEFGEEHTATSILPFSPRNSPLTSQYRDYARTNIDVVQGVAVEWSARVTAWDTATAGVTTLAFSPDGATLASGSGDNTVRVWDASKGICVMTLDGHVDYVTSVVFSPKGSFLASASADKTIRLWDSAKNVCLRTLEGHSHCVLSVAFSPNGSQLASASRDKTVRLWKTRTGVCFTTIDGHTDSINSITYSPDGARLASASDDNTAQVWITATGDCIAVLKDHSGPVRAVAFSPDGSRLVSASNDNTVRLWDATSFSHLATLTGHSDSITSISMSPDGSQLATGSSDKTVRVWSTATGACTSTFEDPSQGVTSVTFSPGGLRLASGSEDGTIRMWDPSTGLITTPQGHSDAVLCAVFSSDGSRLATGSKDKTVRVWGTKTGDCLATLEGHSEHVTSLVFSPDGLHLTSTGGDIREWDLADLSADQAEESPHDKGRDPNSRHYELRAGRLFRSDAYGASRLVCIIPAFYDVTVSNFYVGSAKDVVALGCSDGRVVIMHVSCL